MDVPRSWLVVSSWKVYPAMGEPAVFLDYERAVLYAADHHGEVKPQYELRPPVAEKAAAKKATKK